MVRLMSLILFSTVFFSACEDPCDKALKKIMTCVKKEEKNPRVVEEKEKTEKPLFLQVCKLNKSKFKKCLGINDCQKYRECLSKAGTDEKAKSEYMKLNPDDNSAPTADAMKEAPTADAMKEAPPADAMKEAPPADAMKEAPPADAMKEAPPADAMK